jgi:hypothetical protein
VLRGCAQPRRRKRRAPGGLTGRTRSDRLVSADEPALFVRGGPPDSQELSRCEGVVIIRAMAVGDASSRPNDANPSALGDWANDNYQQRDRDRCDPDSEPRIERRIVGHAQTP